MKLHPILLALLLCASWCFICTSVAGAGDVVQVKDGKLIGLPKEYSPAELDLKPLRLRIRDREVHPALVRLLCPEGHQYGIDISASATHDPTLAPRSITLHIMPTGKDFSYELTLNLDNLEVINLHVLVTFDKDTRRRFEVEVSGLLREMHRGSIRQVPG
jgi:hypothetical protein